MKIRACSWERHRAGKAHRDALAAKRKREGEDLDAA
jgi:hypothetical protein